MKCLMYRTTPFHTSPLCCAEDLFTSRSGYTCGESCETKEMTWNSMLWHRCERGCSHDLFLSSPSFLSLFSVVSDRLFPGNKIKCKYLQQLMHFSQKSSYQYSRVHRLHIVHGIMFQLAFLKLGLPLRCITRPWKVGIWARAYTKGTEHISFRNTAASEQRLITACLQHNKQSASERIVADKWAAD